MHRCALLLSPLLALTLTSCNPLPYRFSTAAERRCFRPCRVEYDVCQLRCGGTQSNDRSLLGSALQLVSDVSCTKICRRMAHHCARDCRGVSGPDRYQTVYGKRRAKGSLSPERERALDARQRELHIKMMKAEGKWPLLQKRCRDFDTLLRTSFAKAHPGQKSHCPTSAAVMRACTRVSPEAVRCLGTPIQPAERLACRKLVNAEDETAVRTILGALADCNIRRRGRSATPTSRPTNQPSSSAPAKPLD